MVNRQLMEKGESGEMVRFLLEAFPGSLKECDPSDEIAAAVLCFFREKCDGRLKDYEFFVRRFSYFVEVEKELLDDLRE